MKTTPPSDLTITPKYGSVRQWHLLTGMPPRTTYAELGAGHLRGVKRGHSLLIDIEHGLAWLASLPPARIKPMAKKAA